MLFLKLICHHKTHSSVSWVMLARWRPLAYTQSPTHTWTRPPEFTPLFEFFLVFDRLCCATLRPQESRAVTERKYINSFSPFANKNWENCGLEVIHFISVIVLMALCFYSKWGKIHIGCVVTRRVSSEKQRSTVKAAHYWSIFVFLIRQRLRWQQ